jgi:hypothetical protein
MKLNVLHHSETYNGLSYGEWAAIWTNWFFSKEVDSYNGQGMLFLRGDVNYRPVSEVEGAIRYQDPDSFLDMTGQKGLKILEGTCILIPVSVSVNAIGTHFEGKFIENEIELRIAVNRDVDNVRTLWATVSMEKSKKSIKLVPNLGLYRTESPLFRLTVPKDSTLNDVVDEPLKPGIYDAVAAGYFVLIRELAPLRYRIAFGSEGPGEYATRSVYDIVVFPDKRKRPLDISGSSRYYKYINPTPKL